MPATEPPGRTRNVAGSPVTRHAPDVWSSGSSRIGNVRLRFLTYGSMSPRGAPRSTDTARTRRPRSAYARHSASSVGISSVVGERGGPPVERCEPERRPVLTLGELVDAGLLERVERRSRVSRMMAALLTWPPERQRPEEAAEQEDGEACPHERLIPADAEETRPPASHVSPDSPAAPSRRPRTRSVLSP